MRLMYIANIRLPTEKAHGIQIMKTCEALGKRGIDVELVVPQRRNAIKENPFDFYGVEKNFRIKRLWSLDLIWLPAPVWLKKIFFAMQSLTFVIRARACCKSIDAVVYTRDLPVVFWLGRSDRTDRTNRNNLFFEVHWLPERVRWYHRRAYRRARVLVAISEGIKNDLIELGIPENKICVARDGVDTKLFETKIKIIDARKKLSIPVDQTVAVYTGHLYEWKGADVLATAAEKLKDIDVYIVGGTKEEVKQFRKKYRYPNLHIVGWRKHKEIPLWLSAADALVLPNSAKNRIGAKDTSPLKLFEYMAAGRPIVASDVPAIREILDGTTAELVKPDNSAALALGIAAALQRTELSAKRAERAFELGLEYTWEKRAGRIADFFGRTDKTDKTNKTNKTNVICAG